MVFPIIWLGILGLGSLIAGCATSPEERDVPEDVRIKARNYPGPLPKSDEDLYSGEDVYACAESTEGWISSPAPVASSRLFRVGEQWIDTYQKLISVEYKDKVVTFFPSVDFQFKAGRTQPKDPKQFEKQAELLGEQLLKVITGEYECSTRQFSSEPVIYIGGFSDRVGSAQRNLKLSQKRAKKIAEAVQHWLEVNRDLLIQPVTIKYAGMGEREAVRLGEADGTANEDQRKVVIAVQTDGVPTVADWQYLAKVIPLATGGN